MFRKFLPALLLCLAAPAAPALASDEPVWAFEDSDLPLDPAFHTGVLDNGMRYIIRHNATPEAQGQVRLFVDAGSAAESETELGYAHFIEHMAFNGSTNVPEGEMIALLEREGLAFGPDTNASTSFDYTLYQLDLPRNDPELLETALFIMRETASELSFNGEAVDREKGVVLSEMRVRDTYALRNVLDSFEFFYPGAYFVDRFPIGTVETLQAASPETLRALYQRIYTPENSVLTVVGDFDVDFVEAQIVERFSSWAAAQTAAAPVMGPVDLDRTGETDIHIDQGLNEKLTISRIGPWIEAYDTALTRQQNLLRRIGYAIISRRMRRLANGEDPPFRSAGLGTSDVFEDARTTSLEINAGDGEWERGLMAAAREYRRAFAFGFSEAEVAEQVAIIRTQIENSAAQADTLYNSTHTANAIALVREDSIPTTPQTVLERFESFVDDITPAAVMDALLEEAIPLVDPLIRFEGRVPPLGGEEALRAAWNAAMAAELVPGDELAVAEFAYTDFGPQGAVAEDTREDRIGIRRVRFANSVMLNLKPTDLKQDRINFEMSLDGGRMLNTSENPLATAMASSLFRGGFGEHELDELVSILAGRSVALRLDVDGETFQSSGVTTARDLELQLQLLAAMLSDPAFRPQGEAQYQIGIANFFAGRSATPATALNNAAGEIISAGDPRFTLQPQEAYEALSFAKLREDIGDRLASGAVEIALVGDFDEEEAIALVANSLGALPARERDFLPYTQNRTRSFNPDRTARTVYHDGAANQAMLRFSWPTRDDSDYRENIVLNLLDRVVQVALTDELRERLGQTYSPSVSASQSRFYTG